MWKKILIGLICLAILGGVVYGIVWLITQQMAKTANQLFALIGEEKIEEAYQFTSVEFQATVSKEEFESFLSKTALIDFESASWSSRERTTGGRGKLEGTIKTKTGGTIPIKIELVKENGKWKIFNITKAGAGIIEEGKKIPEKEELISMTNETMLLFAEAIEKEDFSGVYQKISELWRGQTTKDKFEKEMNAAFKDFIERKDIDLMVIKDKTPVFSEEPSFDENGWLKLNGYYSTQPYTVFFTLKYVFEYPEWKPASINVKTETVF